LNGEVARAAKSSAKAPSDPHVSLLYKKLPRATQRELAAVMRLPFRSVVFDSIAAVRLTFASSQRRGYRKIEDRREEIAAPITN